MTLQDIRINPDNHAEYDIDPNITFTLSLTYKKALDANLDVHRLGVLYFVSALVHTNDANLDVHRYFDSVLPKNQKQDYGGRYATWLTENGLASESENGWWSVDAVKPENITAFVEHILSLQNTPA